MLHSQTTSQAIPVRDTYVYKVVDGREIEADVIGADPGASKPCVVWIHGGGLIFGWRKTSPASAAGARFRNCVYRSPLGS